MCAANEQVAGGMNAAARLAQTWITKWLILDAAHVVTGDPIAEDVERLQLEVIALLCLLSGLDAQEAMDAAQAQLMAGIETAKCVRKAKEPA